MQEGWQDEMNELKRTTHTHTPLPDVLRLTAAEYESSLDDLETQCFCVSSFVGKQATAP